MGKNLIIKGADFSENGMHATVVTVDKSALYNESGVQVTSENFEDQGSADALYYYVSNDLTTITSASNLATKIFSSKFDAEGYDTLIVSFSKMPDSVIGVQGFQIGIAFADANNAPIKVYTAYSGASGDNVVKVATDFSGEIDIPSGTKWIYITDKFQYVSKLSDHSVVIKKYVFS